MCEKKFLVTTIPSDSHTWNLIFIEMVINELGFDTHNVGPCASFEKTISAIIKHSPKVVVVSTVNGHGYSEGMLLIKFIRNTIPEPPRVIIGGLLTTEGKSKAVLEKDLLDAGYWRVFQGETDVRAFKSLLLEYDFDSKSVNSGSLTNCNNI